MKGLRVDTYRNGCDCTNGGVSASTSRFSLFDEAVDLHGFVSPVADEPTLLVKRDKVYLGGYLYAVPADVVNGVVVERPVPAGHVGWMNGGNLVASCDSRFSNVYGCALPVHDRSESYELYRAMGD